VEPGAHIEASVRLSAPSTIAPGAFLRGDLSAGSGLVVHPGASLGSPAQHRQGGAGAIRIGTEVEIWDYATIHAGSSVGRGITEIGNRALLMAYCHLGHDVVLADDVTVSNGAQLGGHVVVGEGAVIGARTAVHQFVRIGRGAMVAAGAFVVSDVPPWAMVAGDRARIVGPNRVGLGCPERSGRVRRALRMLRSGGVSGQDILEAVGAEHPEVRDIAHFIDATSKRGLCRWGSRS
jgi:UDP-N-acetylglucosamine acyltransferase